MRCIEEKESKGKGKENKKRKTTHQLFLLRIWRFDIRRPTPRTMDEDRPMTGDGDTTNSKNQLPRRSQIRKSIGIPLGVYYRNKLVALTVTMMRLSTILCSWLG
jgi:hypothetical protein